ncbi:MAG: hypothetical protein IH941_13570 [Acidobacteria bacterium]|nr:hypothetical protein [Acidobacteriota bacterium]
MPFTTEEQELLQRAFDIEISKAGPAPDLEMLLNRPERMRLQAPTHISRWRLALPLTIAVVVTGVVVAAVVTLPSGESAAPEATESTTTVVASSSTEATSSTATSTTAANTSSTSTAPPTTQTTFTPIVTPDGVTYIEPTTQITVIDDLTLVVQESNIGPCLEVRTEAGGMAGGCGADFGQPLNVGFGGIREKRFTIGWAPVGTIEVVITLADGEIVSVTTLHSVEGYDVLFFLALLPSSGNEPGSPPIEATAFDAGESPLASVSYGD